MADLISRQDAIDELHGKDSSQIWDAADIEVWLNSLPPAEPRWIPVTVRLPEKDEQVLVYLFGEQPYISWIDSNSEWNTENFTLVKDEGPIAWMLLPKPWKGGAK